MLVRLLGCIALVAAMAAPANSEPVVVKKSFWSGWQYSTDGQKFEKVGMSGSGLRSIMAPCSNCLRELDAYRSRSIWGAVAAGAGGVLIGFPVGQTLAGNDWETQHTAMVSAGGALAILGALIQASGSGHLQEAVRLYNEKAPVESSDARPADRQHESGVACNVTPVGVAVVLRF